MTEWENDICGDDYDGMTFSTIVNSQVKTFWIISMVILSFALTSDNCDHLMHLSVFALPWKVLLLGQVIVSMSICVLNACLTAGTDSVVDILMNAVGLMILNDLDNIVGKLYVFMAGLEDDESFETCGKTDRIFSLSFAFPHVLWVIFYSMWFLGIFQFEHPPTMFWVIIGIQTILIPIALIIWYAICFAPMFEGCRKGCLKCIFVSVNNGTQDDHGKGAGGKNNQLPPADSQIELQNANPDEGVKVPGNKK